MTPPQSQPRNEAAERLRSELFTGVLLDHLDAALAEERRHVIEQIRERVGFAEGGLSLWDILDDLSTPEQDR